MAKPGSILVKFIADMDAAIDALQLSVEALEEKIDDLEDKQGERETEARALKIDELSEKKETIESQIGELEEAKSAAENAVMSFEVYPPLCPHLRNGRMDETVKIRRKSLERKLLAALIATLEWIDAVPDDTAHSLPAMPGFDRDEVDALIADARAALSNSERTDG